MRREESEKWTDGYESRFDFVLVTCSTQSTSSVLRNQSSPPLTPLHVSFALLWYDDLLEAAINATQCQTR